MFQLCLFIFLIGKTHAVLPPGYLLEITRTCGSDTTSDASINVFTDLQSAEVKAICSGNVEVPFTTTNGFTFNLPVSYPGHTSTIPCVFNEEGAVTVRVLYGALRTTEDRLVSCSFASDHSNNPASAATATTSSSVDIVIYDVLGRPITINQFILGRKLQLKGFAKGDIQAVGVRATTCSATDEYGTQYIILKNGCGDGIVFKKDEGFTTKGLTFSSPFFEAFRMKGRSVTFHCNSTLCQHPCDGSSCV